MSSSIISLTGGILRTTRNLVATNFYFPKTVYWEQALVKVNNVTISLLHPNQPNRIEVNMTQNIPSLCVNDMIVYQQRALFNYNIVMTLNKDYPNTPHASIFKSDMKVISTLIAETNVKN